jgi:hypothetical protein
MKKKNHQRIWMPYAKVTELLKSMNAAIDTTDVGVSKSTNWQDIGLKYVKKPAINKFYFDILNKDKFLFATFKYSFNLDGIHFN